MSQQMENVKYVTTLINLYSLFNSIEEVKTTPIHEIDNGIGYDFTMTAPLTLHFFHWK